MNVNVVNNQNDENKNNIINGEIRNRHGALEPEANIQGPRDGPPSNEADSQQILIQKSPLLNPEGNQALSQEGIEQLQNPEEDEDANEFQFLLNEDGHG